MTVWCNAPVSARSSKDDPVGIPPIIHQQTLYDSVVLTEHTGVIRGLPTDSDQWNFVFNSDCSKVLTCIIYNIWNIKRKKMDKERKNKNNVSPSLNPMIQQYFIPSLKTCLPSFRINSNKNLPVQNREGKMDKNGSIRIKAICPSFNTSTITNFPYLWKVSRFYCLRKLRQKIILKKIDK